MTRRPKGVPLASNSSHCMQHNKACCYCACFCLRTQSMFNIYKYTQIHAHTPTLPPPPPPPPPERSAPCTSCPSRAIAITR
eukprot:1155010-Pelagomonas_calceolata.AAC.1